MTLVPFGIKQQVEIGYFGVNITRLPSKENAKIMAKGVKKITKILFNLGDPEMEVTRDEYDEETQVLSYVTTFDGEKVCRFDSNGLLSPRYFYGTCFSSTSTIPKDIF